VLLADAVSAVVTIRGSGVPLADAVAEEGRIGTAALGAATDVAKIATAPAASGAGLRGGWPTLVVLAELLGAEAARRDGALRAGATKRIDKCVCAPPSWRRERVPHGKADPETGVRGAGRWSMVASVCLASVCVLTVCADPETSWGGVRYSKPALAPCDRWLDEAQRIEVGDWEAMLALAQ
jgi:hypothetical protein